MRRGVLCAMLVGLGVLGTTAGLSSQQGRTITVRILNGKTGSEVNASNVLIQFDHHRVVSGDWYWQNDDGSLTVKVPPEAHVISVHATYDAAMEYYTNCDMAKQKHTATDPWYPLADILNSGIVMPNDCVKRKDVDKIKIDPQKGVFVVYVRERNWREHD